MNWVISLVTCSCDRTVIVSRNLVRNSLNLNSSIQLQFREFCWGSLIRNATTYRFIIIVLNYLLMISLLTVLFDCVWFNYLINCSFLSLMDDTRGSRPVGRPCLVFIFSQSWYILGHSLGQTFFEGFDCHLMRK